VRVTAGTLVAACFSSSFTDPLASMPIAPAPHVS
jgi:hypothetical protein